LSASCQYFPTLPNRGAECGPQGPFEAFVGMCALLCLLSVDGARIPAGGESGERRGMAHLARRGAFWLAAGVVCWLGVAAILVWRGAPGMLAGSETPGAPNKTGVDWRHETAGTAVQNSYGASATARVLLLPLTHLPPFSFRKERFSCCFLEDW